MLVDVEEPQDRAGVRRLHLHGAAAVFGRRCCSSTAAPELVDAVTSSLSTAIAGAAVVELDARQLLVVEAGTRCRRRR